MQKSSYGPLLALLTTLAAAAPAAAEPEAASSVPTTPPDATAPAAPPAAAAEPASTPPPAAPRALRFAGPAGAYGEARIRAVIEPFRRDRSVEVMVMPADLDDGTADVLELDAAALAKACAAGDLVRLDADRLAAGADGAAPRDDYLPGGIEPCGAATMAWSSLVVLRPAAFKKSAPRRLGDVFDAARYPGKRALPKGPRYTLEMALLADGAAPDEVYALLETEAGVERALARLSALGDQVVWTERPQDGLALLAAGKAAVATAFSGRAFEAIARGAEIETLWHGQIYDVGYLAIRKDSAAVDRAYDLVGFATDPRQLARIASLMPYGPMRRSALPLVDRHATLAIPLAAHLPTAPDNLANALRFDAVWWAANEARLAARLEAWRQDRKLSAKAD